MSDHLDRPLSAAALSAHPDAAVAIGEAVGSVLERSDPHPDLAILLVAGSHIARLEGIVAAVRALLAPELLLGTTTEAVSDGAGYSAEGVAILTVSNLADPIRPVRLVSDGHSITGLPAEVEPGGTLLAFGHHRFPVDTASAELAISGSVTSMMVGMPPHRGLDRRFALIDNDGLHDTGGVGLIVSPRSGQLVGFDVGLWDEDDPIPEPPIDPVGGRGVVLVSGRRAAAHTETSIDLEVLHDRLAGAVIGMVGRQATGPPSGSMPGLGEGPDRVSGMMFGRYAGTGLLGC